MHLYISPYRKDQIFWIFFSVKGQSLLDQRLIIRMKTVRYEHTYVGTIDSPDSAEQ